MEKAISMMLMRCLPKEEVDTRFNVTAIEQGYSLLRLHCRDMPTFAKCIKSAVVQCQERTMLPCLMMFSPPLHKWGIVKRGA